ncbi:hydroquinone glucosyltransferase [Sarracenia purpurea var. burkii]
MDPTAPHVALLPSPGMGHLIPFVEFATHLVRRHHFSATIFVPTAGPPLKTQKSVLEALSPPINHVFLPPVSLPTTCVNSESQIFLTVTRSLPHFAAALRSLTAATRVVALVVDAFALDAFDVADELGIHPYLFFTAGAVTLSFGLHLPELDEMVTCEFRDLPEPLKLPGCVPIHGRDLLDPVQDRSNDAYKKILSSAKRFRSAEGIILNSFLELEEGAIKALTAEERSTPPVYPIGPLVQTCTSVGALRQDCLRWLDDQPGDSVLFAAFGSGGTLSQAQLNELAFGLEFSGRRFLWVVRIPDDECANAAYFGNQPRKNPLDFLPEGFLERTSGRGLVVPSWAPQIEVLSHRSTGGFLTHCGWNSTVEAAVHGVPLIAWPLYAEQKMNAVMLTEGIRVALRPEGNGNEVVGRKEIAKVVKELFEGDEGKEVRWRMERMKEAAAMALREGGSSAKSLFDLAKKWKKSQQLIAKATLE